MSNFVIFEDQENFQDIPTSAFVDARKDRVKLAPLAIQAINKENAAENQVRKKIVCRFFRCCYFLFL